ncbi:predicted protein [Lichtheimia corymbifera JMRC:FSU:9682]|uniref:Uncharacterized protein n=1 Tax=Lichtheimia corymbifera JMRC:FSU:9682 TaxID=1263082 RepID=A0A068RM10_9FUNG|nr:predicted protein [Lichtheimia corymbifera JMRC:FSU:9682]
MSHDQQDNPPAWAMALIERLQALESQQQQQHQQQPGSNADESMEESINDPFISTRSPETDLHLYPEFKAALPGVDQDFFRRPLPEAERRRFLADCPRNLAREYLPPVLNDIPVSRSPIT